MATRPPVPHDAFTLSLRVSLSAIEEGRLALLAYLESFDLDQKVINRLEVVLEEIVSNVVRHAHGAGSLTIAAACAERGVCLTVEDDGAAFDPLQVPEPAPLSALDDAVLGGQGIPLIRRLSKTVRYERAGPFNRLTALIAA